MRKLKWIVWFCLLLVVLVGCSGLEEEPSTKRKEKANRKEKTEDVVDRIESEQAEAEEGKPVHKTDSEVVEEDEEVVSDSGYEDVTADIIEDDRMTLEEKLYDYEGLINVNGEMCHAIWGKTGALVWQWHDSTFDEDVHLSYAMATDMAEVNSYGSDSSAEWDAFRFMNWSVLYGVEEPFYLYHIGDDMFMLEGTYLGYYEYSYYINGNSRVKFTPESVLQNEKDFFYRHTDYSDGYAICQYKKAGYDTTRYLTLMDKYGELTISDIPIYDREVETVSCGIYSDGLFYYDWAFYDINFNKVLDLAGAQIGTPYVNQGLYTPHFVDGVCTMVTEKNGKYWIFDMDKNGEIISEIEEFDIWSLNI